MNNLAVLRKAIDRTDMSILQAISRHLAMALDAEKAKRAKGEPIVCPDRKEKKLARLIEWGKQLNPPLDPNFIMALWELLHGYFVQEELKQREAAAKTTG